MNILNGGAHADNNVIFRVYGSARWHGIFSRGPALRCGDFHHLKAVLKGMGLSTAVGDEGGLPQIWRQWQALEVIEQAVANAGYRLSDDVTLALIVLLRFSSTVPMVVREDKRYDSEGFVSYLAKLCDDLLCLWKMVWMRRIGPLEGSDGRIGDTVQLVGDDLFVCFTARIEQAVANSILIKHQIGTLTETLQAINGEAGGYTNVISHRSAKLKIRPSRIWLWAPPAKLRPGLCVALIGCQVTTAADEAAWETVRHIRGAVLHKAKQTVSEDT